MCVACASESSVGLKYLLLGACVFVMKQSRGTARISKLKTKNLQRKRKGEQAGFITKPQNSISNRQRLEALPPSSLRLAYGPVTPCVSHQVELHNPGCSIHTCQGARRDHRPRLSLVETQGPANQRPPICKNVAGALSVACRSGLILGAEPPDFAAGACRIVPCLPRLDAQHCLWWRFLPSPNHHFWL